MKWFTRLIDGWYEKIHYNDIPEKDTFTYWLDNEAEDCGLCDPPLEPQKALHFLCNYLLGPHWYVAMPESQKQANTSIVIDILQKYSWEFNKEIKEWKGRN